MKKILFLAMATLLIAGCSEGEDSPINPQPGPVKEYIINLGFSGEITNIEESPLTKAFGNDLYGVQVFSMPTTETDARKYKAYAYGLFDDKTKMTIKLLEGYKYKFVSTMVVDGKSELIYRSNYSLPFNVEGSPKSELNNVFTYTTNKGMYMLDNGAATMSDGESYNVPILNRYYGELIDYIPNENKRASIYMKRVSFGAEVILEGFNEGRAIIAIKGAPILEIKHPEVKINKIFTFNGRSSITNWTQDDYTEKIPVSISWEKKDGAVVPLVSQDITFKRNKLTTITVKAKDNSVDNGVDVTEDKTEMGKGDNIVIDSTEQ